MIAFICLDPGHHPDGFRRAPARAHTVELNLEPSEGASLFAESRLGPASRLVPAFVEEPLSREPLLTLGAISVAMCP